MKNKKVFFIPLTILIVYALSGFMFSLYPHELNTKNLFTGPSSTHIFGTDSLGRDLFLRIGEALFYSMIIGISASIISLSIGVFIGSTIGYMSQYFDLIVMRLIEVLHMIPQFLLISVVFLVIDTNSNHSNLETVLILILSMSLCSWMNEAVSVRNLVLKIKNETYVMAAKAIGASTFAIIYRHILLNLRSHIKVLFIIQIPQMIMFESVLSFLGIGLKPPIATFGVLAFEGWQNFLIHPYGLILPSLILFILIFTIQGLIE